MVINFTNIKQIIIRYLLKVIYHNTIVIRMDGGICSQIHFFLIGLYFADKQYSVKFDLEWYLYDGYDMNHKFVRNFDLLKLNKSIPFAKTKNNKIYRKFKEHFSSKYDFYKDTDSSCLWKEEKPPLYFGQYFRDFPELFTENFKRFFNLNSIKTCLDDVNMEVFNEITKHIDSVAVHVRRGDLVMSSYAYGNPCNIDYFKTAINYFLDLGIKHFFFFSDEPEWIKDDLLPQISTSGYYKIIDVNGSDRGYMDLVLIGACKNTITSKGSLGKYGSMTNNHPNRIMVFANDDTEKFWQHIFPKSIYM